jgi:hypothetical protein
VFGLPTIEPKLEGLAAAQEYATINDVFHTKDTAEQLTYWS